MNEINHILNILLLSVILFAVILLSLRYFFQKRDLLITLALVIKIATAKINSVSVAPMNAASGIIWGQTGNCLVYSPCDQEGHAIVLGGSGSGKTSALLIPTLRSWTGSSFVIDISGDISSHVDCPHKMIFEPGNQNTVTYNVFSAIDDAKEGEKHELLERLAYLIMPVNEHASEAGAFYQSEGRKILTAALIAYYFAGLDFIEICEHIISCGWRELLNDIASHDNQRANNYIASFQGANESNTAGCKQALDAKIKLFATNDSVKACIGRPSSQWIDSFSPASLETHNVFCIIPDAKLALYAPLLHIITSQCLDYFSERNNWNHNILFALDEFASFGRMDIIGALRKLRKKGIRIMVLTQSVADIDLIYGKAERQAMFNNFRYKVVLEASDPETQKYIADLIGMEEKKTVNVTKTGFFNSIASITESKHKDYIVAPSNLSQLKNKLLLLTPDGLITLRKNYYFKNK